MLKITSFILVGLLLASCTSVKVSPLSTENTINKVCIENNPAVTVPDFVQVLSDGFDRHGIMTEVVSSSRAQNCEYVLTYTALRSWDMTTYLSHAELRINHHGKQIASADYHLNGKGGLSLTKWASVKSKMDPVIDKLLAGYALPK